MSKRGKTPEPNDSDQSGEADAIKVAEEKAENESLKERHYLQIRELTREVKEARAMWHDAKDLASSLKKSYESQNDKLLELISRGPEPQRMLPGFTDGADSWRTRPITELGLPDGLNETLSTEGIVTLGDLQRFWNSGKYLSDIKGIGPEKSATVSDAFADYGVEHPELFQEQIQPDEEPADSDEADTEEDAAGDE